jgi:NADP-dependent 3-hydroxy acid dehydrogenase YdfG
MAERRTAVVTGASSGIGACIARALGELGWRVALGARRTERLEQVAEEVERAGGEPFAHPLDVADPSSVTRFFDACESAQGVADVVVSNAGLSYPGRLQEVPVEKLRHEVAVNLVGPMLVCHRALPPLLERGRGGDLVFISSDTARIPKPQMAVYSGTKAGLEIFVRGLGLELEGSGIRCTIVRPGPAFSEYAADWGEERIAELLAYWQYYGIQHHPGTMPPEAVARAVVLAVTTPPGVILDTIEVQPEAPRQA